MARIHSIEGAPDRQGLVILAEEMRASRIASAAGLAAALLWADVQPAASESAARAQVRMLAPAPLGLRGLGFAPLERVRLTVTLGETRIVRGVRATRRGSFTAVFPRLSYTRCKGALRVKAAGEAGARVAWELTPLDCPLDAGTAS